MNHALISLIMIDEWQMNDRCECTSSITKDDIINECVIIFINHNIIILSSHHSEYIISQNYYLIIPTHNQLESYGMYFDQFKSYYKYIILLSLSFINQKSNGNTSINIIIHIQFNYIYKLLYSFHSFLHFSSMHQSIYK